MRASPRPQKSGLPLDSNLLLASVSSSDFSVVLVPFSSHASAPPSVAKSPERSCGVCRDTGEAKMNMHLALSAESRWSMLVNLLINTTDYVLAN